MKYPWTKVESSNLDEIAFDDQVLKIRFKNGNEYHYEAVPESVFKQLMSADSLGRAFHSLINAAGFHYTKVA